MSFIKTEKMRVCQSRLNELRAEREIIFQKLEESEYSDSIGEYADTESLNKYKEINNRINAIMGAIKALQGIDSNDIIQ